MVSRILSLAEATALQTALNQHSARLVVDGHWGELSRMSLMRFQADHDIQPADGNPTQSTLNALGIPDLFTPPVAPKRPSIFTRLATIGDILNLLKGKAMTTDQITGIVRLVLGLVSGYFITRGIGSADLWNWIIGGVLAAIPAGWSWYSNRPKVIMSIADKAALK